MPLNYRQFRQVGSEQWIVQPNLPQRVFLRLFGPLGVHARIRNTRVINAISQLDLPGQARILDVGCGHAYATFWLARHYPQYEFLGIELDETLVRAGQKICERLGIENVNIVEGKAQDIKEIGGYDLIFSIDVLEHIEDDVGTLAAIRQALQPGGYLILHLPRRHQEHRRFLSAFKAHVTPDHVRDEYTENEIRSKLEETNFKVEGICYGFSMWGELAFESNYLFWKRNWLRVLTAILLHPLSLRLAYMDTRKNYKDGNSLLVIARPATFQEKVNE